MANTIDLVPFPELVIAVSGAIGVDIDLVVEKLTECLSAVGYGKTIIKLTDEMYGYDKTLTIPSGSDFFEVTTKKIADANDLCKRKDSRDFMAKLAVRAILVKRRELTGEFDKICPKHAFIIKQLKRKAEVDLLKRIYGKQFILISAYGSVKDRTQKLIARLKDTLPARVSPSTIVSNVYALIHQDEKEDTLSFGQDLRETYALGDVFVNGMDARGAKVNLERFINAFFGSTTISPSKSEYGMYAAMSASLRSADLSRQVGAAIVSSEGEVITQGCNEVPRAFGGTYWDLESPDHRDVVVGKDPNERVKRYILREVFERLLDAELLSADLKALGSADSIVKHLTAQSGSSSVPGLGALRSASIMDLTEYGRVVHAEMCAICDAARLGRSVRAAILFCTTFPCHNCTKHILAVGIKKVIYIEPYPKSRAKELHEHEIELESEVEGCVSFLPFMGISPQRYRDIFQKGRRKDNDGNAKTWIADVPKPMIEVVSAGYTLSESIVFGQVVGSVESVGSS